MSTATKLQTPLRRERYFERRAARLYRLSFELAALSMRASEDGKDMAATALQMAADQLSFAADEYRQ